MRTSDFIRCFSVAAATAFLITGCGSESGSSSADQPSAAQKAADAVKDTATSAADAASDVASSAADAAGDAMDSAKATAEDAMDAAMDKADDAMDGMKDMADDAMDGMKEMATDAAAAVAGISDDCKLSMDVGDIAMYSTTEMSVPSSCTNVAMTLNHTGRLPKVAMGHNWVLIAEDDLDGVVSDGASAGVDGNYVPANDDRVIAATKLLAGGESDTVTFAVSDLDSSKNYVYVCTFPGHWAIMKGTFKVG